MKFFFPLLLALVIASPVFADSDRECQVISDSFNPTEAGATDDFLNLTDGTFGTTAAAEDEFVVPIDMVVWGLSAEVDVAPGGTDTYDIAIVDDGTLTIVVCEILGTATTCQSDETLLHEVAAFSDLTVVVDTGNGAGDPDAAAEIRVAFCLERNK